MGTRVPKSGDKAPAALKRSPFLSLSSRRREKEEETLEKRLLSGVMSSLKDDGGRGPSPSPSPDVYLPLREANEEGAGEGMIRREKLSPGDQEPRHPMFIFQSVWALGPTGVGSD